MIKRNFFLTLIGLSVGASSAVTVTVAPTTGVTGTAVTNSIADAVAQVNAGADAENSIILRSTEGAHVQAAESSLLITAGKSVAFTAESGQPVIVLQKAAGQYMLTIGAGLNANSQTETLTFNGIAFVPQTGISYAHNKADGLNLSAGKFAFTNCVFSFNNGSNGVGSQEGNTPFTSTNGVGDDWIQINSRNNVTFSNSTITGAYDDAVLIGGAGAPEISTTLLNTGTCIANNGGAGIQVFGSQSAVILDGESGRVLIANNGRRAGTNDTGIKYFADLGCSLVMNKADLVGHTNGGIFDFDGVPTISITESRVALNNSAGVATAANFSIAPTDTDNGATVQNITLDNVTFHDALGPDSIFSAESATNPQQVFTIVDSIFSGAGDSFANMTNSISSVGPSPAPAVTFTAVVTAGPHAIAAPGDLGAGTVNADPLYASTDYTIGRSQENLAFLSPASPVYATSNSSGGQLRGGAPMVAGVSDFMLY